MKFKILVIGHHIIVDDYQTFWVEAAKENPDLDITLVYPEKYYQNGSIVEANQSVKNDCLKRITLPTIFGENGRQHLFIFRKLEEVIDKTTPDFVYAIEEANSLVTYQIAKICSRKRIRYSFWSSLNVYRNYSEMYGYLNPRRYLFNLSQKNTFKTASLAHFTTTNAHKVAMKQGYSGDYIISQTHGVSDMFYDAYKKRKDVTNKKKITIGYAGRYWHWKGLDILIKAISEIHHNHEKIDLVMYGDGEKEVELKELAKLLNVEVTWRPAVSYNNMPEVFLEFDIFVLPSLTRNGINEKFGRVLIEAMATGCAVIGSNDGGIPNVIKNNGLLFNPGDSENLKNCIEKLIETDTLKRYQEKGHAYAIKEHSYKFVSRKMINQLRIKLGI
ncbi:glycosyltransferase family 4 protein [Vibrio harveyi]|nr:glycosyltransferase family 4 protein [Vibrio harveyi]